MIFIFDFEDQGQTFLSVVHFVGAHVEPHVKHVQKLRYRNDKLQNKYNNNNYLLLNFTK